MVDLVVGDIGIILKLIILPVGFVLYVAFFRSLIILLIGLNNLIMVLASAGCELISVWIRTERNTRQLRDE